MDGAHAVGRGVALVVAEHALHVAVERGGGAGGAGDREAQGEGEDVGVGAAGGSAERLGGVALVRGAAAGRRP